LVLDSPSDYAKKGDDIAAVTGGGDAFVTELAKEAAQRAHPGLASDMVQIVCLNLHQICGYGTTHGCQCLCWHGCSDIHRVSECADGGR